MATKYHIYGSFTGGGAIGGHTLRVISSDLLHTLDSDSHHATRLVGLIAEPVTVLTLTHWNGTERVATINSVIEWETREEAEEALRQMVADPRLSDLAYDAVGDYNGITFAA